MADWMKKRIKANATDKPTSAEAQKELLSFDDGSTVLELTCS